MSIPWWKMHEDGINSIRQDWLTPKEISKIFKQTTIMQLFESVVFHVTKNKDGEIEKGEIIIPHKITLEKSKTSLEMRLIREIPEKFVDDLDNVTVVTRAF